MPLIVGYIDYTLWIAISPHVAALLSAFLCLRLNVQIPWLPSMRVPVLEKVEWFIGKTSVYHHDKQFGKGICSCLHLNKPFGGLAS